MSLGGVGHVEITEGCFGWGKELIIWLTDIIGFSGERWCFLGWGMVDFGVRINMFPINGWDTNNVWQVYGLSRNPHAHGNVKRIMWSILYNTRAYHIQLMIHSGCVTERLNTILIWRTTTLDPWHSHGMLYLHDWWPARSGMVDSCMDSLMESQSLYVTSMLHQS